jgi:predicted RNase H-like HicB family nuclease
MLSKYILSAMRKARYETLEDDNTYYGDIPGFKGVYANADTLEDCREELEEVLEEWLFLRISRNLPITEINGIKIKIKKIAI